MITISYNNDVLTWDYKDNKYQVTINQFQGKEVNIFAQDGFIM